MRMGLALAAIGLLCCTTGCATVERQPHGFVADELWKSRHSRRQSLANIAPPSTQDMSRYTQELNHNITVYLAEHPIVPDSLQTSLRTHRVVEGMSKELVTLLCGTPDSILHAKEQEVWKYNLFRPARYQLYFRRNLLARIEWVSAEPL